MTCDVTFGFEITSSCRARLNNVSCSLIEELQRAKRASEAQWVGKIGNPSSRENMSMTSPYERPSSVQTLKEGEGNLNINLTAS